MYKTELTIVVLNRNTEFIIERELIMLQSKQRL